jgi:hypothetical protein
MPRETLPTGASLLALARGGLATASEPSAPTVKRNTVTDRDVPALLNSSVPRGDVIGGRMPMVPTSIGHRKQKVNARISGALLEEIRDCVVALSGPPHGLTMDEFAEEAYRRELERLKGKHAAAKDFPRRPYNPRPGRRVS